MRITGQGPGFGRPGGERDRAAAFRARHSIGQRVRGRIVSREPNGLYWVQVGGEELLARLEVQAEPGDEMYFIVRALSPEIMLQALTRGQAAADLPGLVQRFRAAREVFEQQDGGLLETLAALPPSSAARLAAFGDALEKSVPASDRLAKVLDILGQINAELAGSSGVEAMYRPWLVPGMRRSEGWHRGDTVAMSGTSGECGAVEMRLSRSGSEMLMRLFFQKLAGSEALRDDMAAISHEIHGLRPSVTVLPLTQPTPRGGVLGELLGDATWSAGGLNTRV